MRVKKGDVLATLAQDTLDAQLAQNDAGAGPRRRQPSPRRGAQIVQAEARLVERKAPSSAPSRSSRPATWPKRLRHREQAAPHGARRSSSPRATAEGGRGREGADRGPAPRARLAARPHGGGGSRRRHRQPPHGAHRRHCRRRRRAHVPHRRQRRGRARRRGHRDAHGRRQVGQPARVEVAGLGAIAGTVRLVSPEVDKATRLGRVRIFLGDNPGLRVGAFARGTHRDRRKATASPCPPPPSSTVRDGPSVQVVRDGNASRRGASRPDSRPARSAEVREGVARGRSRRRARRHLPARRRRRAPVARRARQGQRGDSDELEHLGLVDPAAGAVAGAVHGADGARLRELRAAAGHAHSRTSTCRSCRCASTQSGAAPSELEMQVTKKVEDAIAGVNGVKHMTSTVTEGTSVDDHRVPAGDQPGPRAQRRQGRDRAIRADLPRTIDEPIVHAHRDRGPADRHLRGQRAGHDAGAAVVVRRRRRSCARCRA